MHLSLLDTSHLSIMVGIMFDDLKEIMLECVALNSYPVSENGCCKEMVERDILRREFIVLWNLEALINTESQAYSLLGRK